jgi:uncharacterized protein (DUF433 family)
MDGPHHELISATAAVRAALTLRETVLLARVPEAGIRKDIEAGIVRPLKAGSAERLRFRWADVFLFAAVYHDGPLPSRLRRRAFARLERLVEPTGGRDAECSRAHPARSVVRSERVSLGGYLFLDIAQAIADVAPRVELYAEGLARIEERPGVLGGEAVFRNTRLSVRHVGKMHDGGELVEAIRRDYPYLRADDVTFARFYYQAHPIVGRPPTGREPPHDRDPALAR